MADRLVQRLVVAALVGEKDRLGVNNTVSFGFIEGKGGVPSALKQARNLRNSHPWVFKSDISSFFDAIDRSKLKNQLKGRLRGSSLIPLLFSAIDCEIDTSDPISSAAVTEAGIEAGRGLRQGMPLSPILSNFVLKEFDGHFERKCVKLIRYADDFVMLADSLDECEKLYDQARSILAKKNHELPAPSAAGKTRFYSPDQPVEFLGLDIAPKENARGYQIRASKKAFEAIKQRMNEHSDLEILLKRRVRFSEAVSRINSSAVGFVNVYRPAKNFADLRAHAENCRLQAISRILTHLFGKEAMAALRADKRKAEFIGISDDLGTFETE